MKLYPFQKRYLAGLPPKFIFAADTGTGKTIMALAHYAQNCANVMFVDGTGYAERIVTWPKKLLILGPAAKMRTGDWQRSVEDIFGDNRPEAHYYSYEKFSRNSTSAQYKNTGSRGVWHDWLKENPDGDYAVICDEVHKIANPQSNVGRVMFEVLKKSAFFVGLSATPLPNGWISAANYFKIFGFVKNMTDFKRRYCNIQTYKGFPEIVGYYHEDEIKRLWNGISKPLKKEDAIELPPMTEIPVSVQSGKAYASVRKEMLFGETFLDNPSALLHALRQSTLDNKLPWLDDFLEGTSSNVVIFYNYVSERKAILELIKKKHGKREVFRQDGECHQIPTRPLRNGKMTELDRSITLAQYQSGSTGIEMQYADTIVFFSPTYSYVTYHQAIGRIERIGQVNKMTVYKMCALATVEEDIWRALKNKSDFSERVWAQENLANV